MTERACLTARRVTLALTDKKSSVAVVNARYICAEIYTGIEEILAILTT
jgi:hypothetical protein